MEFECNVCSCLEQCDQLKLKCSRCTRLDLQCTGAGVQRFKFVVHDPAAGKSPIIDSRVPSTQLHLARALPGNGAERLLSSLHRLLGPDPERSSSLTLFGPIFAWLPSQIGAHPALDAAIAYTVQGHRSFHGVDGAERAMIKSGSTAVTCLQRAVITSPSDMSDAVLMAMVVHCAAEVWHGNTLFRSLSADWLTSVSVESEVYLTSSIF